MMKGTAMGRLTSFRPLGAFSRRRTTTEPCWTCVFPFRPWNGKEPPEGTRMFFDTQLAIAVAAARAREAEKAFVTEHDEQH